ncbi:hypothetical protein BKA80DRAFT_63812 [Phyllosticta citrichinensis]
MTWSTRSSAIASIMTQSRNICSAGQLPPALPQPHLFPGIQSMSFPLASRSSNNTSSHYQAARRVLAFTQERTIDA